MTSPTSPITQVLTAYASAVYDQNADAFMQLYTVDARVFDTWGACRTQRHRHFCCHF